MRALAVAAALLLAARGEPKDGALTADEEQQLNDAAAMLDEPADDALDDGGTAEDAAEDE